MSADLVRLDKFLSASDKMLSRREASEAVRRGRVAIDGKTVTDSKVRVGSSCSVTLDGEPIFYRRYVYLMMNKPKGTIVASSDSHGETLVTDFLPGELLRRGVFPVGRLDRDTTGLLIFTDDGSSAHRALSPKSHVSKTYAFECAPPLTEASRRKIESGVDIGERDGKGRVILTTPAKIEDGRISVTEGKFHQIKRMFHAAGHEITSLSRMEFAGISLDLTLEAGGWRYLTDAETSLFTKDDMIKGDF
ncbi:MAG: rRNA pseudouridine synthase [Firmicutes bacterium]|nr:rRNA pseudouridine synthase [Bacillota bacterium]